MAFESLVKDVTTNEDSWKTWYDLEAPEVSPIPLNYTEKLSEMQQLLLLRCFRPDRVFNAVKRFVIAEKVGFRIY